MLGKDDDNPPGAEYNPLADEATALRQRSLDCHRAQGGPPWLREVGRWLTEGGDLAALSAPAMEAVLKLEGRC